MTIYNLTIKKLADFQRLSERSQSTFAANLKIPPKPKIKKDDDDKGGNYWVRCISGIKKAYSNNDNTFIKEKIEAVLEVSKKADTDRTRTMYRRNLHILYKYEKFDFSVWLPKGKMKFIKTKTQTPLSFKDIPIKVLPHFIFTYGNEKDLYIGGILFVVSKEDYNSNELTIFTEAIFRYLSTNYSEKYKVDPNYCLTVDASSINMVNYQQILDGKINPLFKSTVNKLIKYL